MSVATLYQALLLEIGLDDAPATLLSEGWAAEQLLQFVNETGRCIAMRADFSSLLRVHSAAGGASLSALPADFLRLAASGPVRIAGAEWTPLRAIHSVEAWSMLAAEASAQGYYHLRGGSLRFAPALPAAGATVDYITRDWAGGKAAIDDLDDAPEIPERLLVMGAAWRWRRQAGLGFDDAQAEFEAALTAELLADRGLS